MCGIVGLLDTGRKLGADRLRHLVTQMRDCMVHRGPDDADVWVDPTGTCALGHRRLSILDLTARGRQPMVHPHRPIAITFNGEIYNYRELADNLKLQGISFQTGTDTEILLHLFADQMPMHLPSLRGMFAFAVWNAESRQLFLARDPFGKKPLYVAQGKGFVAFASEMQALELLKPLKLSLDPEAIGEYLLLQYVQAPRSIYREVEKLPPGHYQLINSSGQTKSRGPYWQFSAGTPMPSVRRAPTYAERLEQLTQLVRQAVARRLVADVPLGAFLSGGVDSALVVAIMKELGGTVRTFSVGFEDSPDTEHFQARQIAEHLGTEHHDIVLKPDAIALAPRIAQALDEPNGDSSCLPVFLLSEFTRQHVTVALSGDGGDEMFGGYGRYFDTLWENQLPADQRGADWSAASGYLGVRWTIFQPEQIRQFLGDMPAYAQQWYTHWQQQLSRPDRHLLHRMRTVDTESYLPGAVLAKVDRMSMQFSLEVRSPLLDIDLADFAATLSADDCLLPAEPTDRPEGKRLLKDLLKRYLPAEWVHRKKMGFGLPAGFWNPVALRDFAHDLLDASDTRLRQLIRKKALRDWLEWQQQPAHFSIYRLWPMLMLELWLRKDRPKPIAF